MAKKPSQVQIEKKLREFEKREEVFLNSLETASTQAETPFIQAIKRLGMRQAG